MFETLEKRAILQYNIVTRSDLHIGGHNTIEPSEVDNPVLKNSEGYPVIPGSSLKGVLRSDMERLLKGLGIGICDIFNNNNHGGCNLCAVCLLFGGKDLASSIRIKDATANSRKTLIRDHVAIDRKKRIQKNKYDTEAVPKGVRFNGTMTIENTGIDSHEFAKLGAILSAIDFFNACNGNLGHATSRGFGEVKIEIEKLCIISAQDYLDANYSGKQYEKDTFDYNELKERAKHEWKQYLEFKRGENE